MPLLPAVRNPRVSTTGALAAAALAVAIAPRVAFAQATDANRSAAAEAYQNGQQHYLRHDYAGAANWFETADRLAPASLAVQNAIHAHRAAGGPDHAAHAATLALRLQTRYPDDARATQLARTTIAQLSPDLARVTVQCDQCEIEIDTNVQSGTEVFVTPGHHAVLAHFTDGGSGHAEFDATAGATQSVPVQEDSPPASAVTPPTDAGVAPTDAGATTAPIDQPVDTGPRVLSPAFFIVGAVATAALGGIAIWSWLDATHLGNQLISEASMTRMADPTLEGQANGAEGRTTILDVATGVVGAATLVTGVFFTRWTAPHRATASVTATVSRGVAGLALRGTF